MNILQLVNLAFVFLVLIPAIGLIGAYWALRKHIWTLPITGLLLIGVGTMAVAMGTDFLQIIDPLLKPDTPNYEAAKDIKIHVSAWTYVFPAVTIAVGANFLTIFLAKDTATKVVARKRRRKEKIP